MDISGAGLLGYSVSMVSGVSTKTLTYFVIKFFVTEYYEINVYCV